MPNAQSVHRVAVRIFVAALLSVISFARADAALVFLGVAAGDATTTSVTLWTRAVDSAAPANTPLAVDVATDLSFAGAVRTANFCTTRTVDVLNGPIARDSTCKGNLTGLKPNTVYYYRFVGPSGEMSIPGRLKTAPDPNAAVPLHFAFSGDNDGLIRPYALATQIPAQQLDFYVNLGDIIYETASSIPSAGHSGPALNSPATTNTGASSSLNGVPTCLGFATAAQLKTDYERKYRENFLPVNLNGQNSLQLLYAAQSNYSTWDNHELGNRQYINGGAPAGASVGGAAGTDMTSGCGVDARDNVGGNLGNVNDINVSAGDYMNRATGFKTLRGVFLSYLAINERPPVSAPNDPRTDGTIPLYNAYQWGRNAIYINTDSRSYRDLRIKTAPPNPATATADDTGVRADNASRTYLGATQFAWLKQTLADAQAAGIRWKFVEISDPIDQLGPIGGALMLNNLPSFGVGSTYAPVNTDGGKSYMGGYRAERNALLKFIADEHITNVVFIATDDHQNRINELRYSPTEQTGVQASYVRVPFTFSIVAGPLGATGPDLITNHTFTMAQQYANSIAAAQQLANIDPLGLVGSTAIYDLFREGDPTANTNPQPVDFYSPDTFNFNVLDVTADGQTLQVTSIGMDATAQNAGQEYAAGQARPIFGFKMDAAPNVADVTINDGSAQRSRVKSVTVTLNGIVSAGDIAPGAFALTSPGGVIAVGVQSVTVSGRHTAITLGFSGAGIGADGSLPDGEYVLTVNRNKMPIDTASPVTDIASFSTLFGDLDGDGQISGAEVAASAHLNGAKTGDADYAWYLDFDANGRIDGKDHREVARRNGAN